MTISHRFTTIKNSRKAINFILLIGVPWQCLKILSKLITIKIFNVTILKQNNQKKTNS